MRFTIITTGLLLLATTITTAQNSNVSSIDDASKCIVRIEAYKDGKVVDQSSGIYFDWGYVLADYRLIEGKDSIVIFTHDNNRFGPAIIFQGSKADGFALLQHDNLKAAMNSGLAKRRKKEEKKDPAYVVGYNAKGKLVITEVSVKDTYIDDNKGGMLIDFAPKLGPEFNGAALLNEKFEVLGMVWRGRPTDEGLGEYKGVAISIQQYFSMPEINKTAIPLNTKFK